MPDCVFEDQSFSFRRIQIIRIFDPLKIHLLLRIPPIQAWCQGRFIYLHPSDPPPHAAMIFLVVPILSFLSPSPLPRPPVSRPRMGLTYSSDPARLMQTPCLSASCAVLRPASLASIANSNSVSTIFISAPTAAPSIVAFALTLTTPTVIGPTLTPPPNSPPR